MAPAGKGKEAVSVMSCVKYEACKLPVFLCEFKRWRRSKEKMKKKKMKKKKMKKMKIRE